MLSSEDRIQPPISNGHFPLVVVLLALASGIWWDRWFPLPFWLGWSFIGSCLIGWWALWLTGRVRLAVILLLLAVNGMGQVWHHAWWRLYDQQAIGHFASLDPQPAKVGGIVQGSPQWIPAVEGGMGTLPRGEESFVELKATHLADGEGMRPVSGRLRVTVKGHLLGVRPGDRVVVTGRLSRIGEALNPGQFSAYRHFRIDRQLCRVLVSHPENVRVVQRGNRYAASTWVPRLRDSCQRSLRRHLPQRHHALADAILLGLREGLEDEQTESFFLTGTIHLLAVSGLHLGILAYGLFLIARMGLFDERWVLSAIVGLAVLYALLTGARAPVNRAALLVVAFCLGWLFQRRWVALNSLAAAAIVVLVLNPSQLFQVGAQLSFLAVFTLSCFSPTHQSNIVDVSERPASNGHERAQGNLERLMRHRQSLTIRTIRWLGRQCQGLIAVSTLIWLVSLPLVMHHFHIVTPVALVLNVLFALPIAVSLFFGFLTMLLSWPFPSLASFCGWVCGQQMAFIEQCTGFAVEWPGSYFWAVGPSLAWTWLFYLAVLVIAIRPNLFRHWYLWIPICVVAMLIGSEAVQEMPWHSRMSKRLQCTFLSIGHGTCVTLKLPSGEVWLYDAGSLGNGHAVSRTIADYLWANRVHRIDAMVLSHADADHYNGVPGILTRFAVGRVYLSPTMARSDSRSVDSLLRLIERSRIPIAYLETGDTIPIGTEGEIRVLHPPSVSPRRPPNERITTGKGLDRDVSDNANSVVLDILYQGRRILLPGDLESPGMEAVTSTEPLRCDVAMAPHHGSAHSHPADFVAWCQPRWMVISGARSEHNQAVCDRFSEAGCRVLHTARDGAVTVTIADRRVSVSAWDPERPD